MAIASDKPITDVTVRMFTMGTGDCFALKFMNEDEEVTFKMMIDAGAQRGPKERLEPYITDLIDYMDGEVDVLVVTHEHQDHVLAFHACKPIFKSGLKIDEVWFAWTEEDGDEKVEEWKEEYGKKKKALHKAFTELKKLEKNKPFMRQFQMHINGGDDGGKAFQAHQHFVNALETFDQLHLDDKQYTGGLKGMKAVKEDLGVPKFQFLSQGKILQNIKGLTGINIYVLGPPNNWKEVKKEKGKGNEAYKHNKDLEIVRGYTNLFQEGEGDALTNSCPFKSNYIQEPARKVKSAYTRQDQSWRRIDHEWLYSSAKLALRLNRGINNLSLVLAIEFDQSKRVMLFPGDAEIGSWESWHEVDWKDLEKKDEPPFIQRLLSNTVFYKVAHHLSHNGTAKEKGLDLMTHPDLVAMATLDYDIISSNWTSTMPNRGILKDLLEKTRGRLILMNDKKLFLDRRKTKSLKGEIKKHLNLLTDAEKSDWKERYKRPARSRWVEYTVGGQ